MRLVQGQPRTWYGLRPGEMGVIESKYCPSGPQPVLSDTKRLDQKACGTNSGQPGGARCVALKS